MVYKYIRKTNQGSWSEESLKKALIEVPKKASISSTAKKYDIPFTTLYRHVKSGSSEKKLGRFRPVFTRDQEADLCNYIKYMDNIFYGVTRTDFLKLVCDYAVKNSIPHPFKNGIAGDDWFFKFKLRNPQIVLRDPEPTSVARAMGFNRPQVERFFTILREQLEEHNFDATSIYNMDETGIRTSSSKPPKILTVKGKKQVGVITSSERGQLTTVICCCNAAGSYVPPFFIFARKRMQDRLLDGTPPGSQATVSDNGWINGPAFLLWLKFFCDKVRPSQNNRILLLLDNHESHKYFPALEYASANYIDIVSFAPHTTNKMQPLDVAVYGPIKKYFEQELSTFQKNHPGRIVSQYDVGKLFATAYAKGATVQNAIQGSRKPGLWPYNPHVFNDDDFAPATITDRLLRESLDCNDQSSTYTSTGPKGASLSPLVNVAPLPSPPATVETNITKFSPFDVRPVPTVSPRKIRRKRRSQRAEVLTSVLVKEQQAAKFHKLTENKRKLDEKAGPSGAKKPRNTKQNKRYLCIICNEQYIEPLKQDWIQCNQCKGWAHESCTTYPGFGSYFCIKCDD